MEADGLLEALIWIATLREPLLDSGNVTLLCSSEDLAWEHCQALDSAGVADLWKTQPKPVLFEDAPVANLKAAAAFTQGFRKYTYKF